MNDAQPETQPTFASNGQYLHWELTLLERRLASYADVRRDPANLEAFYALVDELAVLREQGVLARERARERGVTIPLADLARRHGLAAEDEEALIAAATAHFSTSLWQSLLHAQARAGAACLETGFLSDLLWPSATWISDATPFEPHSPLLRHGLMIVRPPASGTASSTLAFSVFAPHYVARFLLGHVTVDRQLEPYAELTAHAVAPDALALDATTRTLLHELVTGLGGYPRAIDPPRAWTVVVTGPEQVGKTSVARALATALGRPLMSIHADRIPLDRAADLVSLAIDNARFVGAVVHLVRPAALIGALPTLASHIAGWLAAPGFSIIEENETPDRSLTAAADFVVTLGRPQPPLRQDLWRRSLARVGRSSDALDVVSLAASYDLTGGRIETAVAWADRLARARPGDGELRQADLESGARTLLRATIDQLTSTSRLALKLEDLALPERPRTLLLELRDACRHRARVLAEWGLGRRLVTGRGVVALFAGDAGTGKTLAAEILAAELGQELRIAAVPQIVSKYIGETEKNVSALFREARARNAMLLFDEADALFGKRVKVERATDHYQNMEVNALLQEIERYEGVVILTSNLDVNMDRAFQRRILLRIDFPMPEASERRRIWEMHIPREAPREGKLDTARLGARFELSGGLIKNAVVQAAYRAFAAGTGLSQAELERAARDQIAASGRLPPPLDRS